MPLPVPILLKFTREETLLFFFFISRETQNKMTNNSLAFTELKVFFFSNLNYKLLYLYLSISREKKDIYHYANKYLKEKANFDWHNFERNSICLYYIFLHINEFSSRSLIQKFYYFRRTFSSC